jgi:hypothetical protein
MSSFRQSERRLENALLANHATPRSNTVALR